MRLSICTSDTHWSMIQTFGIVGLLRISTLGKRENNKCENTTISSGAVEDSGLRR